MADDSQLELQRKIEVLERKNKLLEEGLHQAERLRQMFDRTAQELKATKLLLIRQGELFKEDITERKRIEARLAESESRLRAIIENEPECIMIVDAEERLVQMNPAGLKM